MPHQGGRKRSHDGTVSLRDLGVSKKESSRWQREAAVRIKARAIRRCGELLKQIEGAKGGVTKKGAPGSAPSPVSRSAAANRAGLSERQRKDALRVASIPERDFERAVGLAVRKGQAEGRIAKRGDPRKAHDLKRPVDYASENELSDNGAGIYAMTDNVTDEEFEKAVEAIVAMGPGRTAGWPAIGRPGAA